MLRVTWLVGVAVASAGCDQVFGLGPRDGGAQLDGNVVVDVAVDAPPAGRPCIGRDPAPMLCADFDEEQPRAYTSGQAFDLPLSGSGVIIERRPPSTTGVNGYWIKSIGGPRTLTVARIAASARKIDATLALRIGQLSTTAGTVGLFRLSLPDSNPCNVGIELDMQRAMLVVHGNCGTLDTSADLVPVSTLSWLQIHLTLDIMASTATASVDGGTAIVLNFGASTLATAIPSASLGIDTSGHTGLEVGYDDITVQAD